MKLDEIKMRKIRLSEATRKVAEEQDKLWDCVCEYAEQEANKAGIVYGETKVRTEEAGPFFVTDCHYLSLRDNPPVYQLSRIEKNGGAEKKPSVFCNALLSDLTIITDESQTS